MKSPTIHLGIAVTLCIGTVIGYGMWHAYVSAKSLVVADLDNQIQKSSSTIGRIAAIQSSLLEIASSENTIQSYFVPEADVPSFNDYLEAQGKAQSATVRVLSVAKSGPKDRPLLTLSLAIDGTFDSVMRTIGVIEYAPYALTVGAVQVSSSDKKLWHADVSLTVASLATATATATTTTSATTTKP